MDAFVKKTSVKNVLKMIDRIAMNVAKTPIM